MYILAIDQGTTGTTTILYDEKGKAVGKSYRDFTQFFPKPGWVEHDPNEIWQIYSYGFVNYRGIARINSGHWYHQPARHDDDLG